MFWLKTSTEEIVSMFSCPALESWRVKFWCLALGNLEPPSMRFGFIFIVTQTINTKHQATMTSQITAGKINQWNKNRTVRTDDYGTHLTQLYWLSLKLSSETNFVPFFLQKILEWSSSQNLACFNLRKVFLKNVSF